MNKNSIRRHKQLRIAIKEAGGFGKPTYKAKTKPFPTPNSDEDVSLSTQRAIFYAGR